MEKLLIEEFGINPNEIIRINGYDNLNYLIKTNSKNYILKTYDDLSLIDLIQAETKALLFLNNDLYPRPVSFLNGENVRIIKINGNSKMCNLKKIGLVPNVLVSVGVEEGLVAIKIFPKNLKMR